MAFLISSVSFGGCGSGSVNVYDETEWTANQAGYQPPVNYELINLTSDAAYSLYGLDLTEGRIVTLRNNNETFAITLEHDSGSATTSAMRLDLPQSTSFTLEPGHTATFRATSAGVELIETTALLPWGSAGGTEITGGTGSGENLTLIPTSSSTPGTVVLLSSSTDTTATRVVLDVRHATTLTAAAGFGSSLALSADNDAGTMTQAAVIDAVWADPADASEDAAIVFRSRRAGAITEQGQFTSLGELRLVADGFLSLDRHSGTPATPAAGRDVLFMSAAGVLSTVDSAGNVEAVGTPASPPSTVTLSAVSTWFLAATLDHTDLTDADTEQYVDAYELPAGAVLEGWVIRTTTPGSGGGVTVLGLILAVEGAGVTARSTDGLSDDASGGQEVGANLTTAVDFTASRTVQVRFNSTGGDLADLSAGEWQVFLKLATLV